MSCSCVPDVVTIVLATMCLLYSPEKKKNWRENETLHSVCRWYYMKHYKCVLFLGGFIAEKLWNILYLAGKEAGVPIPICGKKWR